MNKYLILLILALSACGPTPTMASSSPAATLNSPSAIPAPQDVIPTMIIEPTATVVSAPVTSASLWLQVLSPPDEAVINTPQVDIIGSALDGTVVSINDEILIVGDDQQFKIMMSLDKGPNLIEIIASDDNGNEMFILLTVTYEP